MKRKIAIILIISLLMQILINIIVPIQSFATEETVTIECEDKNFYNALVKELEGKIKSKDDSTETITMTKESVNAVTGLNLNGLNTYKITNIIGIQNFTNLTELNLSNNSIDSISPLTNLTELSQLDLDNNNIDDISPLTNLTELSRLDLSNNNIDDISPLTNLSMLTYLYLNNNNIDDISPLTNLTELSRLDLSNNNIDDISPLTNLTNLTHLYLSNNNIDDISPLSDLSSLQYLFLNNNEIIYDIPKDYSKNREIELPQIIQETRNSSSDVYTENDLQINNCKLTDDNNKIIVDTNIDGDATVVVKGGIADGTALCVKLIDDTDPELKVTKKEEPTNQPVTVTIESLTKEIRDEEEGEGWRGQGWEFRDWKHMALIKTFETNTTEDEHVTVYDLIGNEGSTDVAVTNINKENLDLEIKYESNTPEVGKEKVTITENNKKEIMASGWESGEEKNIITKIYEENLIENINVSDLAGNTKEVTISVNDISGPKINKVEISPSSYAKDPITVSVTSDEEIHTVDKEWTQGGDNNTLTREYTDEGCHKINLEVQNNAGATTKVEQTIFVDKTAPEFIGETLNPNSETKTTGYVEVALTVRDYYDNYDNFVSQFPDWSVERNDDENNNGLSDFTFTRTYYRNVTNEEFKLVNKAGNELTLYVTVNNIVEKKPYFKTEYSETQTTCNNVRVTITSLFGKEIQDETDGEGWKAQGWTLSEGNTILEKTFETNTEKDEVVNVKDVAGNEQKVYIDVTNIDNKPLELDVTYDSEESSSAEQVTVTIKSKDDEKIELVGELNDWQSIDDGKALTNTYTTNTSEIITVRDVSGNTANVLINVNNIKKQGDPEFKLDVEYTPSEKINGDVTVTLKSQDDEKIEIVGEQNNWQPIDEGKILTKTYRGNISELVTVKNMSGLVTSTTVKVNKIDKEDHRVIDRAYEPHEGEKAQIVRVTLTLNEEVQLPAGWMKGKEENTIYKEYDTNTEEDVAIKDFAGNDINEHILINNIDNDAPDLVIKYSDEEPTNENVTVMIISSEEILDEDYREGWSLQEWTLSEGETILTKTFKKNTEKPEFVTVKDFVGNEQTAKIEVNNIDKKELLLDVTYDPPEPYSAENVTVTIKSQDDEEINTNTPRME